MLPHARASRSRLSLSPLALACLALARLAHLTRASRYPDPGGNIVTASPISDMIPLLVACGASLTIASTAGGTRVVPIGGFFTGYRKVDLQVPLLSFSSSPTDVLTAS